MRPVNRYCEHHAQPLLLRTANLNADHCVSINSHRRTAFLSFRMEPPPWETYLPQFPLPAQLPATRCQQIQWTWIVPPVLPVSPSSEFIRKSPEVHMVPLRSGGPVLSPCGYCWRPCLLLVKSVNGIITSALCSLSKIMNLTWQLCTHPVLCVCWTVCTFSSLL